MEALKIATDHMERKVNAMCQVNPASIPVGELSDFLKLNKETYDCLANYIDDVKKIIFSIENPGLEKKEITVAPTEKSVVSPVTSEVIPPRKIPVGFTRRTYIKKKENKQVVVPQQVFTDIYVLELEGGNYYVGKTLDLVRRMDEHFSGGQRAAEWCKLHRPIKLVTSFTVRGSGKKEEERTTIEYMLKYGWKRVRGYSWSQCDLQRPPVCIRDRFTDWV
jgi:predicted GIY-YIG superfamily endonuclease